MKTKSKLEYALQGNFRLGFPDLYNSVANTREELDKNADELRQAVADEITIDVLREQNLDYLNWEYISCWRRMKEDELREFKDYVKWNLIKAYQLKYLSEDFKREFSELLDE